MLPAFLVWIVMLIFIFLSIRLRRRDLKRSSFNITNQTGEPMLTPISTAVSSLVGVAGGIYLSVVLLLNFLKIPLPETREILGCYVDPVAFISLWVAILQPVALRFYGHVRNR